jgi:glycine dehydrogenase subunit 1
LRNKRIKKQRQFTLEKPVNEVLRELAARQILGGYSLAAFYPKLGDCLLVCATEMRTAAEIERYVEHLQLVMKES